jgi:hypothetical protein
VSDFEPGDIGPEWLLGRESRRWRLELDEINPGLSRPEDPAHAKVLAMHSIATVGRCDDRAFHGASLVGIARHRGRVEVTFVPPGWDGLQIRAAWSPAPVGDGVDLEVQIHAATARVIERVEVGIRSEWGNGVAEPRASLVEPRDVDSAALSYDGRESPDTLQGLTTLPVPPSSPHALAPRFFAPPGSDRDTYYVEMIQPNDCARRIRHEPAEARPGPATALATWYGLFGHDLEKGVVLRARLRGLWIRSRSPDRDARACYEAFLSEPPALGP